VLDRAERAQLHRRVHDGVDASVLRLQCTCDVSEILGPRRREIERQDGWLRISGGGDLVVQRFELAHDSPVQYHGRALGSAGEGEHASEAAARSGDEHDATIEQSAGSVIAGR
jgi:hypothetical protein